MYYVHRSSPGALHQLGEHERELAEARRGISFHPDLLNMRAYEARALVALGRFAEVDALVDQVLAMAPRWAYAKCCVPNGTPGYVMLSAAEELRAHGRREAALEVADRAAEWYRSRPGGEAEEEKNRAGLGESAVPGGTLGGGAAPSSPSSPRGIRRTSTTSGVWPRSPRAVARVPTSSGSTRGSRSCTARTTSRKPTRSGAPAPVPCSATVSPPWPCSAMPSRRVWAATGEAYGYALVFRHSMDLEALRGDPAFEALLKPKE